MQLESEVIYYGDGNDLHIIRMLYPELKISCICDKDFTKQKSVWCGIPVISSEHTINEFNSFNLKQELFEQEKSCIGG